MSESDMIKVIDARLRYLFTECPRDKYNMDEINALVNLLKEYDPDTVGAAPGQEVHIVDDCRGEETLTAMIALAVYIAVMVVMVLEGRD